MAELDTKTFDQLVEQQATAVQAEAVPLTDFSTGSLPRAFAQAFAAVVMWLQAMILQLLTVTRAATSTASDLDTWMADYGQTRLPATAASGPVTFGRHTATAQAIVTVGALVQTADATVQYQVVADANQPAYSASAGGYILAPGTATITATVQALTAGSAGNATAGAISVLGQAISGVDYVVNGAAFDNGTDAESDANFRTRFATYLASLSKATLAAIGYSITSIQQGLSYAITECQNYAGATKMGYFYAVVDDGSGSPSSGLLANVTTAIDATRACGIQFAVFGPATITANVGVTLSVASGYSAVAVKAAVQTAITDYISALTMGQSLLWSRLVAVIYGVEGVASFSGLVLNGGTADLTATSQQVIIPGTVVVS